MNNEYTSICISLRKDMHRDLKILCAKLDVSMQELISALVETILEEEKKQG